MSEAGYDVMLYRSTQDENVLPGKAADLKNRADMANRWGADYFISIHTNASTSPAAAGFEQYVYSLGGEAEALADSIARQFVPRLGSIDRGVFAQNFSVLRNTSMPAVLVELGYLSNPTEALNLGSTAWRGEAARAVADGIAAYVSP